MRKLPSKTRSSPLTYHNPKRDGKQSTLEFRGHRVEDLAQNYEYEDVSYCLIWGHMPSQEEKQSYRKNLALAGQHIPQSVVDVIKAFPY